MTAAARASPSARRISGSVSKRYLSRYQDERRPGAEDEVALQQRALDDERAELVVRHVRSAERATDASRSKPGDPGSRTTAEPSAYETPARSSDPDGPKSLRHAQTASAIRIGEPDELPHSDGSFGLRAERRFFGSAVSIACTQVRRS